MVHGGGRPELDGVVDHTRLLVAALRAAGVEVVEVPFRGLRRTVSAVRAAAPDVVHVQFAPSAYGFAARVGLLPDLVPAPVVTTVHEYGWWAAPSWVPARWWDRLERDHRLDRETWRLVPAGAAVVTTNPAHEAAVTARTQVRPVVIPLAPNVFDRGPVDRGRTRARLGVPANAEVVVFFGFVHPVKGVRYLVDAVAALRAAGRTRLHLLVVGGFTSRALPAAEATAFRSELGAHVDERGVSDHVTMTGRLADDAVSAALHAADVAAFPFTAGATTKSGALLSAFAHRLPTVVTAADPPDPALVDGATVVVAATVRDGDALAAALGRVLDDDVLRARLVRGGAGLARDRTWPRIAAAHQDLYASVGGRVRAHA
jgi:glycosyltransferase involved in cell wall biosynthesis